MVAAENFSNDVFHSNWCSGSRVFRKKFSILLTNACQQVIITSGIFFECTLENFVTVINTAYEFYAVMQNWNHKSD